MAGTKGIMSESRKTVVFGEIMARLCPPGFERLRQSLPGRLEVTFAGAEANVAVSLAYLGAPAGFITSLPDNPLAEACLANLRGFGVDVSGVRLTDQGRLGLYFVERGANQRPSRVVYDRSNSSVSLASPDSYDWERIFRGAAWFHFTGVTPALSQNAADCCRAAVKQARAMGVTVSCDLNFREKLWRWEEGTPPRELAKRVMTELLPEVDLIIANEADASDVLGIQAGDTQVDDGRLDLDRYPEVAARIVERFPRVRSVAVTLRESISASHNNWGAMFYTADDKTAFFAPLDADGRYAPYDIRHIVDRVGAGDSFAAGLIFARQQKDLRDPAKAVAFATAASCLAHSVEGDYNLNRRSEVEALMSGARSGRVVR